MRFQITEIKKAPDGSEKSTVVFVSNEVRDDENIFKLGVHSLCHRRYKQAGGGPIKFLLEIEAE